MPILICLVLFLLFPRKTLTSFIGEITSVFVQPGGKQMAVVVGTLTYYVNSHRGLQSLDATWLPYIVISCTQNIQGVKFYFLLFNMCSGIPQGTPISRCHMAPIHSYQLYPKHTEWICPILLFHFFMCFLDSYIVITQTYRVFYFTFSHVFFGIRIMPTTTWETPIS